MRKKKYMFYLTAFSSVISFALMCLGGNATERDMDRLNKLIKKSGSCVKKNLESVVFILKDRRLKKTLKIKKDKGDPLNILMQHRSKRPGTRVGYSMPGIRMTDMANLLYFPF